MFSFRLPCRMMHAVEPMALGSPGSPPAGGPGMVQSPFLPAYLMGETTPLSSPVSKILVGSSVGALWN